MSTRTDHLKRLQEKPMTDHDNMDAAEAAEAARFAVSGALLTSRLAPNQVGRLADTVAAFVEQEARRLFQEGK